MSKRIAFMLVSSDHGSMIIPRFDYKIKEDGEYELGVGATLCEFSHNEHENELKIISECVTNRRKTHGDGVVMIDGGANLGTLSVSMGKFMDEWGHVIAFEPQDRIFMCLCGNIVLNNTHNVLAYRAALGSKDGTIKCPIPDYLKPGNFGGLNANGKANIGQKIEHFVTTPLQAIDALQLNRLDVLKLDVEGMEIEALTGALTTINRFKPYIFVEWFIAGLGPLTSFFSQIGYNIAARAGCNVVAAYGEDEFSRSLSKYMKA